MSDKTDRHLARIVRTWNTFKEFQRRSIEDGKVKDITIGASLLTIAVELKRLNDAKEGF